jgi:hypothetical protein
MELHNRRGFIAGIVGLIIGLGTRASSAQAFSPDDPLSSLFGPQPAPSRSSIVQPDPKHMLWASQALVQMQTVRVGMTRSQMEGVFAPAGGFHAVRTTAPLNGSYSFRECPFFKVDVEFEPVRKPQRDNSGNLRTPEDPKDVITKISKPYLEQVYYD